VLSSDGDSLPFTFRDRALQFFSGRPGSVRVLAGNREFVYSLTLPQLWDSRWQPPPDALKGIPRISAVPDRSSDLWPFLAVLGVVCLLAEWVLYGRFRRGLQPARAHRLPVLLRKPSAAAGARR
jgi:hypothetical protein